MLLVASLVCAGLGVVILLAGIAGAADELTVPGIGVDIASLVGAALAAGAIGTFVVTEFGGAPSAALAVGAVAAVLGGIGAAAITRALAVAEQAGPSRLVGERGTLVAAAGPGVVGIVRMAVSGAPDDRPIDCPAASATPLPEGRRVLITGRRGDGAFTVVALDAGEATPAGG